MRLFVVATVVVLSVSSAVASQPEGLAVFAGRYGIRDGAAGVVEIAPALGGSFLEWTVKFEEPKHELRYIVGSVDASGRCPIWRFESDPAPLVKHEGSGRFAGGELLAEFPHVNPADARILRERWTLRSEGLLEFKLETSSPSKGVLNVGSFKASRQ